MIHLDQNHPPSIAPHTKSNLILNSNPHADQQSILSWSSSPHDDRSFYQEPQEQPLPDQPSIPSVASNTPSGPSPQKSPTTANTTPPIHTQAPKPPDPSPSSPPDARSPAIESSSSLSPPPDTTSPAFPIATLSNPDSSTLPGTEHSRTGQDGSTKEKADEVDKASRASTPLSELSSDPDDPPENNNNPGPQPNNAATSSNSTKARPVSEDTKRIAIPPMNANVTNGHANSPYAKSMSPSGMFLPPNNPRHISPATGPMMMERSGSIGISSMAINDNLAKIPSTSGIPQKPDPKVVAVLELNTHLLKVFMEFQARSISPTDPRCQPYSTRLQSNLTWLAAAADEGRKVSLGSAPLPNMQAPPPTDFGMMDRISQIYAELPTLFAKDIARRQQIHANTHLPGQTPSPALKRDRPDDSTDLMNKRRDTGEAKAMSTPLSNSSSPHQPPILPSSSSMSAPHNLSLHGVPSANTSMPPPSLPTTAGLGPNEAQLAAQRERARQMQIRQALQQQQQQQIGDVSRQISPTGPQQSGMQGAGIAGPSSGPQQQHQAQLAAIASMGPAAIQAYQILQNHSHPVVQYLNQSIPSFSSLPLQQQLQRVQMVITQHARNQQNRAAAMQAHSGGSPANFGGGVPSMSNTGAPPTSGGLQNGSPTRSSPVSQQPSMVSQTQQGAGFFHNSMPNATIDHRATIAGLTPQQQANLANMNPQHRQQLFLMQQQQQQQQLMQRGAVGSGMMNPQMVAQERMQQQRMVQAGSPTHHNPVMMGMPGVGSDGASFPVLRSNPGVPGIARSIRTPSDHMQSQSPITPQLAQRTQSQTQDDYQRAMMQQGQRGMTPAQDGSFMQMNNGGMQNSGWSQSPSTSIAPSQTSYGMTRPNSAGVGQGPFGGIPNGVSSPVANANWSQGGGGSFAATSPVGGQQAVDSLSVQRQASMTPAPHPQMSQNSPVVGDQSGMDDFGLFNWNQ